MIAENLGPFMPTCFSFLSVLYIYIYISVSVSVCSRAGVCVFRCVRACLCVCATICV